MLGLVLLLTPQLRADSADLVLTSVYGSISTACTQDADADTGENNRLAMAGGKYWVVYCHDGAYAGVGCECLQGDSTVDASAAVGLTILAGEKVILKQRTGKTHISCVPSTDNSYIDLCPLD